MFDCVVADIVHLCMDIVESQVILRPSFLIKKNSGHYQLMFSLDEHAIKNINLRLALIKM